MRFDAGMMRRKFYASNTFTLVFLFASISPLNSEKIKKCRSAILQEQLEAQYLETAISNLPSQPELMVLVQKNKVKGSFTRVPGVQE